MISGFAPQSVQDYEAVTLLIPTKVFAQVWLFGTIWWVQVSERGLYTWQDEILTRTVHQGKEDQEEIMKVL